MPKIRNVSPYGALRVPLLRRRVEAGEEVDVTAEQAAALVPAEPDHPHPNFVHVVNVSKRGRVSKENAQ